MIWIASENFQQKQEGGALIPVLLTHFPWLRLDIVNSKVLTRIGIERDLNQKGG